MQWIAYGSLEPGTRVQSWSALPGKINECYKLDYAAVAQLAERLPEEQEVSGSSPLVSTYYVMSGRSSTVERLPAMQEATGSKPVARSSAAGWSNWQRRLTLNQQISGSNPEPAACVEVAERQTRKSEVPVPTVGRVGFDSHLRHCGSVRVIGSTAAC